MTRRKHGILLLAMLAILFAACDDPPSVEAACRDYMRALDEENEVLAIDAVERLAEGFDGMGGLDSDDRASLIAYDAFVLWWGSMISGGFPADGFHVLDLYFLCGTPDWPQA